MTNRKEKRRKGQIQLFDAREIYVPMRRSLGDKRRKIGDGEVLDLDGAMISFSYSVAGVGYTVSQDLGALIDRMPPDRMAVLGPVSVKFLRRNPANSIVICEEWTGLRRAPQPPRAA